MGWIRSLLGLPSDATLTRAAGETPEPSVTFSHDLTDVPTPVDDLIHAASSASLSNAPVRRDLALSVPAVLRGRNMICAISTLPLITRRRDKSETVSPLLEQIDRDVPNLVTLAMTVEDLLFDSLSWWRVTERDAADWPRFAQHVDLHTVSLNPPPDAWRRAHTLPSGQQLPAGVVWVNGVQVDGRDMIRFDSPNPPLCKHAARTIRRALLLEQAAALYANDPRPTDYFEPHDSADPLADDEIGEILDDWQRARQARKTAYVPAALKYHTVSVPSPAELQLAELQKQATIDLANTLGLDSEDLQVSTTSRTYANAVDRRRDRINDVLSPYMLAITARLSMNDITRRGERVEFDLDDYLRADPKTRWETHEIGLRNQAVTVQEVRDIERLPAIPVEPRPAPRPAPTQPQEAGMTRTRTHAFSEDAEVSERMVFELSSADAQFAVDRETRTVSGLLVPWNRVARAGFRRWRFAPNSLTWSETSRVKLNREHDRRTAVAYAMELQSTDVGLSGKFKVARGAAGDDVLSLAEDKVLDGFSIEVDFAEDGSSWAIDPADELVRLVTNARLVGCAITAAPSFDDARVTGVAASRNTPRKDTTMPDTPQGQAQETPAAVPGVEVMAAFTAAVEAFTAQSGSIADAVAHLVEIQQTGAQGPSTVDPTRGPARFSVTEEPLYRFDGSTGKHDFSSDIIAGAKGDYDAAKRAEDWIKSHFAHPAGASFAVTSGNVATLNPVIQRPDLYVDQMEYPTPIWDAIRKGTIDSNTPFVLPKFATATGMVANHAEGVEPTPGGFTTTSQTITPTAVSGKVEVTREAWDQGGNPQLSTILWRQMTRAYYEALEQASADLLESLAVTAIALTAGAVDAALADEVESALGDLHFIRGGFRFEDFVLEKGLYKALTTARDTTGRTLYPNLGATNASGTTGRLFGAINIAGLAGLPSWALPFVNAAPNDSYLFNREDVHGWASNPQRLEFQYRVAFVDVAVWGYKALACTRTDGVRKITYDNTV